LPQRYARLGLCAEWALSAFGLKFSLPTLYDAYAPQNQVTPYPLWEHFQGGTFDIIIRPPQ